MELEKNKFVDLYPLEILHKLDDFLTSKGHNCIESENGIITLFNLNEFNEKLAISIANHENHFSIICALPIREDAYIIDFCAELIKEINIKMLDNYGYESCHVENYLNMGVNISRKVQLSYDEHLDVEKIFKAICDISSLIISFKETMHFRFDNHLKQKVSLAREFDKMIENVPETLETLECEKRKTNLGCLIASLLPLAYVLLIVIAFAIEGFQY